MDDKISRSRIQKKKLLGSKWTAVTPKDKEKHFIVLEWQDDEQTLLNIEAVHSNRVFLLPWQALKEPAVWQVGWN